MQRTLRMTQEFNDWSFRCEMPESVTVRAARVPIRDNAVVRIASVSRIGDTLVEMRLATRDGPSQKQIWEGRV